MSAAAEQSRAHDTKAGTVTSIVSSTPTTPTTTQQQRKVWRVFVIKNFTKFDYVSALAGVTIPIPGGAAAATVATPGSGGSAAAGGGGIPIEVIQANDWKDLSFCIEPGRPLEISGYNPRYNKDGQPYSVIAPDLIVIRSSLGNLEDYRHMLYALRMSGVECINGCSILYQFLERVWPHSLLCELERKLGSDRFPLIPQYYCPDYTVVGGGAAGGADGGLIDGIPLPCVVKVGKPHAGYGKMRFFDRQSLKDFVGVLALHRDYFTIEPYLDDAKYDIRIQVIGHTSVRVMTRTGFSWKTNTHTNKLIDIESNPLFDCTLLSFETVYCALFFWWIDLFYGGGDDWSLSLVCSVGE